MVGDDPLVLLLDLDNTLLDSDGLKSDVDAHLAALAGDRVRQRFWQIYEDVRQELGLVSFPVALQRLDQEAPAVRAYSRGMAFLEHYQARRRLYPGALAALRHLRRFGVLVVVSDGEEWFQRKKVTDSGIAGAVDGNILIFPHKEEHLDEIRRRYPAAHYAFFDDKPRLIAAMKERMGAEVTTVWLQQGHYAQAGWDGVQPAPDLTLAAIAQARWLTAAQLRGQAPGPAAPPTHAESSKRHEGTEPSPFSAAE